jgi:hypothetical protein
MIPASTIGRCAVAAVVTFVSALAGAWPSTTEADDFGARVEDVGSDTTVSGTVQVTSRLVEDAKAKGKWLIEIEAKNTSPDAVATAQLQEQVLKESMASMMARSGPIPTVAWKINERVEVLPNETAVLRHPLPAWLSSQIAASRAAPKLDREGAPVIASRTSFMTRVAAVADAAPRRDAPQAQQARVVRSDNPSSVPVRTPSQSRGRSYGAW